jgi:trehalose-6-phosphatase
VIDFDGTLIPFQKTLNVMSKLPGRVLDLLHHIMSDSKNHIMIVSGRTTKDLDHIFADFPNLALW